MKRSVREELRDLFRSLVCDVNDVLTTRKVSEEVMWELARRLHTTWHQAVGRLDADEDEERRSAGLRHPALSELLRLVNLEVEE